jgi:transcription elongation factor GreA
MSTLTGTPARHHRHTAQDTASTTDAVLTAEGRAMFERKATELRTVVVPGLLRAVAEDAHDEQTRTAYEDKLHELLRLEALLANAGPMPAHRGVTHQVRQGDLISVAFLRSRKSGCRDLVEQFRLVHPVEAPLDLIRISVTSPLGQAVLGRCVGDLVEVAAPAGRQIVQILWIEDSA